MCPFDLSQNVVIFQVKCHRGVFEVIADSEFKCQKPWRLLLRDVFKMQAPPLILKADPHFEKNHCAA